MIYVKFVGVCVGMFACLLLGMLHVHPAALVGACLIECWGMRSFVRECSQ